MDTLRLLSKLFLAVGLVTLVFVLGIAWLIYEVTPDGSLQWMGVVFLIIPAAFIGVSLKVSAIVRERDELVAWLALRGESVTAEVLAMTRQVVKHSGRIILHVTARWQQGDGAAWTFQSGAIDLRVGHVLKEGGPVEILIDPADPNRYVFALSMELEALAHRRPPPPKG